jgi:hypothetical protein
MERRFMAALSARARCLRWFRSIRYTAASAVGLFGGGGNLILPRRICSLRTQAFRVKTYSLRSISAMAMLRQL